MPIARKVKVLSKTGKYRWSHKTFDSHHEQFCYDSWVTRHKLNEEDFDHAYKCHSESLCCDWCKKAYKNSKDKQMDHCHKTNKFRNILCNQCNSWRNTCSNIYKTKDKRLKQGFYWDCKISRNGKIVFRKYSTNKEVLAEALTKFKAENPFYFPFESEKKI